MSYIFDWLNSNLNNIASSNGYVTTQSGANHIDCGFKPSIVMLLVKTNSKIVPIIYNKNVSSTTYTNDGTEMTLATSSNVNSTNGLYIDDTGFYWYQTTAYQVYYLVAK